MKKLMIVVCALAMAGCEKMNNLVSDLVPPQAQPFGVTAKGEKVLLYTLRGAKGLTLEVTDFGGRVVRCLVPDKNGAMADVTLGWNTVAEYEKNGFSMGTLIGRYGNRIRDGKFTLDGKEYQLPINEAKAPRHCNLHGGPDGWDTKVWVAEAWREQPGGADTYVPCLTLTLVSPDGDMGFPGTVKCTVTYKVLPNNTWTIDYEATTDKPTVVNLTHHSYWNLAGEASGNVLDQELQVFADKWTKTDDGLIPIKDEPVAGTGFDFTAPRFIGAFSDWMGKQESLKCTDNWYDHNFVLRGKAGELKPAATMCDLKSGRRLEVWTTEPCLQVYGAQNMDGTMASKTPGKTYPQFAGVALETQHAPDSPNHAAGDDWPTTVLRPGETFRSHTEYRFSAQEPLVCREPAFDTLIAHRGESYDAPENTLPAYKTAVERGFGFECDIYLSKDGKLYTFHDGHLTRTTSGANTNDCTAVDWETVAGLNVGGWGKWTGSKFDPTRPALFSEVLALARDGREIYVEVKRNNPEWVPFIREELVRAKNVNPRNVLFISFGEKVCAELKRQLPEYRVYWLTASKSASPEPLIEKLGELKADGVDICFRPELHTAAFVKAVHDAGYGFHIWTVDSPKVAELAFAAGADTLTTNRAKYLLESHQGSGAAGR